ncbi:hypothetical protein J2Z21_004274 [Streptomyces griseochromogenes]|uniref:Uncharacterized protein n=1 Tax=Streptomyces griseochromogenes TaxID=68214 RepID=A0ABS4LV55_9ACTN|nr:hypothetical protein [Streptomyces griseochromogenes]
MDGDRNRARRGGHRPDEAAHYRRTLPGWVHGPHDVWITLPL